MAGGKAAESLRAEGFDGRVVIVGAEPVVPYERPPLSKDYLAGSSPREKAFLQPADWWAEHEIELLTGRRATAIDVAPHNLLQVAIYTDNAGKPGTKVVASDSQTAVEGWNTVALTTTLAANTKYWLLYNTNASSHELNELDNTALLRTAAARQPPPPPRTLRLWRFLRRLPLRRRRRQRSRPPPPPLLHRRASCPKHV